MTLDYFSQETQGIPLVFIKEKHYLTWLQEQSESLTNWVKAQGFTAKAKEYCVIHSNNGHIDKILVGVSHGESPWSYCHLPEVLPQGIYVFDDEEHEHAEAVALGWGMGSYEFNTYRPGKKHFSSLVLPKQVDSARVANVASSIHWVRDLINTPMEDLGPEALGDAAAIMARENGGKCQIIKGKDLLKKNYPAIHAVGRASTEEPRLIDITWGKTEHPKVTLVGKGVCFDSGGLDIKSARGMRMMKKDMGGAANALGLARMIMQAGLPIRLRVLIPAVENAIAGNAYRPGDVINTRKGLTVEIDNTDAEGRVVLADALCEAASENPQCILDFATLTGAARVAVGTEIAALFSNDDDLAKALMQAGEEAHDPLWQLPLFKSYRQFLHSSIADICNSDGSGYAGAITAALFLKEFVPDDIAWAHFDMMAWRLKASAGSPEGGEAMAIRAVFRYLSRTYGG